MNIEKLRGHVEELKLPIKSYRVLCEVLEIPVKGGDAKKAQLKDLERYIKFHKEGNAFILDEFYDVPLHKEDNRKGHSGKSIGSRNNNNVYNDKIQLLILDLLVQNKNKGHLVISKNQLLKNVNMINENYTYCGENIPKLSKYTNITETAIYDFYNASRSNFKSVVEIGLKNLKNKSLIFWKKVIYVCVYDEHNNYEYREATPTEQEEILQLQKGVLKEMHFKTLSEAMCSTRWVEFRNKLESTLHRNTEFNYYYTAYDIIVNEKYIMEEYEELLSLLLDEDQRIEYKNYLNSMAQIRLQDNAKKRQVNASKGIIGIPKKIRDRIRLEEIYLPNHKKLVELLINQESKNIVEQVKNWKN